MARLITAMHVIVSKSSINTLSILFENKFSLFIKFVFIFSTSPVSASLSYAQIFQSNSQWPIEAQVM
jgi:hypothetical protein